MIKNKKALILGSSLMVALVLGGYTTYSLLTKAATAADVTPAVTCAKNIAAANKVTTYTNFTTDVVYYCYQGKGSTSKLMLTGNKYAKPDYYRGPVGGGYTDILSVKTGDLVFYQSPKFGQFPPPGSTNIQPVYDTLIGIAVENNEIIRLNDTRTAVVKTSMPPMFLTTNPMQYKFLSGRSIATDANLRSFRSPETLTYRATSYTMAQQLENLLLVNYLQSKGAPNYQQSSTTYGLSEFQQITYIQRITNSLTGTGKDISGQVGSYTWNWIYQSIDTQPVGTGKG